MFYAHISDIFNEQVLCFSCEYDLKFQPAANTELRRAADLKVSCKLVAEKS